MGNLFCRPSPPPAPPQPAHPPPQPHPPAQPQPRPPQQHAPHCTALFFPSRSSVQEILRLLSSARTTLDVAVYNVTLDAFAEALLAARKRGARVRLVTDASQAKGGRGNDAERLGKAGVEVRMGGGVAGKGLMHHKYAVVDGHTVATGSLNYTRAAAEGNWENVLVCRDAGVAGAYAAHFEKLFADPAARPAQARFSEPRGLYAAPLFFPTEEATKSLLAVLNSALHTLDAAVFNATDDGFRSCLLNLHKKGVRVRFVTDKEQRGNPGNDAAALEQAGVPVRTLGEGGRAMHDKFAVVDGRVVATGSFNWTKAARYDNHENVLLTNDAGAVAAYSREFEHLWSGG
ncbi:hypothetical protein DFJ74DRAFT_707329 [Hyaloraphidium curvatum]|nr:hypothetical protein DFJ74DRAFT_707329 [Hyaloraphidium curvatum]